VDGGFTAHFNQLCVDATSANPCLSASTLHYGPRGYLRQTNRHGKCDDSLHLAPSTSGNQSSPPNGFASYRELDRRDWKLGTEKRGLKDWAGVATSFFRMVPRSERDTSQGS